MKSSHLFCMCAFVYKHARKLWCERNQIFIRNSHFFLFSFFISLTDKYMKMGNNCVVQMKMGDTTLETRAGKKETLFNAKLTSNWIMYFKEIMKRNRIKKNESCREPSLLGAYAQQEMHNTSDKYSTTLPRFCIALYISWQSASDYVLLIMFILLFGLFFNMFMLGLCRSSTACFRWHWNIFMPKSSPRFMFISHLFHLPAEGVFARLCLYKYCCCFIHRTKWSSWRN